VLYVGTMRRPWIGLVIAVLVITPSGPHLLQTRHAFLGDQQTDFSVFYDAGYDAIDVSRCIPIAPRDSRRIANICSSMRRRRPRLIPLSRLPVQIALRWWYVLLGGALLGAFCLSDVAPPSHAGRPTDLPRLTYGLILVAALRP